MLRSSPVWAQDQKFLKRLLLGLLLLLLLLLPTASGPLPSAVCMAGLCGSQGGEVSWKAHACVHGEPAEAERLTNWWHTQASTPQHARGH